MISCKEFVDHLRSFGIDMATGVPDSTFKDLISYFEYADSLAHIRASNECEAVAISAGHYLATNKPAVVYMQNSGFGKTINPYTSLCSREIYGIAAIFMVGWRGRPGIKDEPQHKMMGRIMLDLLSTLEMPYAVLSGSDWKKQLTEAYQVTCEQQIPYVIVLSEGLFEPYSLPQESLDSPLLMREQVLELVAENTPEDLLFVSTTGKTSREIFEIREKKGQGHTRDFLTVGSMGCASAIGFGIALARPERKICVIDGDGAALMQLGTLATLGHYQLKNLIHILIDNNVHESTGGQATVSDTVDFGKIGKACGYSSIHYAFTESDIVTALREALQGDCLTMIIVSCKPGSRKNLGRPTSTPLENKVAFMKNIGSL